jgi:hypothetical protein
MVVFSIHFDKLGLEVGTYVGKYVPKQINGPAVEYLLPILRYEDQMNVHLKNTVPTMP